MERKEAAQLINQALAPYRAAVALLSITVLALLLASAWQGLMLLMLIETGAGKLR